MLFHQIFLNIDMIGINDIIVNRKIVNISINPDIFKLLAVESFEILT